eukprot:TRINITY_DN16601_c0_g1_i1.p2 TRINITY_DN16601_c0_g1~~TRINITY_DN16601_c0_g1_i1.p2  ORF type:complete len:235 (+),score=85.25 TRINITY_DN16601_c0_g1_i1:8-712(+)
MMMKRSTLTILLVLLSVVAPLEAAMEMEIDESALAEALANHLTEQDRIERRSSLAARRLQQQMFSQPTAVLLEQEEEEQEAEEAEEGYMPHLKPDKFKAKIKLCGMCSIYVNETQLMYHREKRIKEIAMRQAKITEEEMFKQKQGHISQLHQFLSDSSKVFSTPPAPPPPNMEPEDKTTKWKVIKQDKLIFQTFDICVNDASNMMLSAIANGIMGDFTLSVMCEPGKTVKDLPQ